MVGIVDDLAGCNVGDLIALVGLVFLDVALDRVGIEGRAIGEGYTALQRPSDARLVGIGAPLGGQLGLEGTVLVVVDQRLICCVQHDQCCIVGQLRGIAAVCDRVVAGVFQHAAVHRIAGVGIIVHGFRAGCSYAGRSRYCCWSFHRRPSVRSSGHRTTGNVQEGTTRNLFHKQCLLFARFLHVYSIYNSYDERRMMSYKHRIPKLARVVKIADCPKNFFVFWQLRTNPPPFPLFSAIAQPFDVFPVLAEVFAHRLLCCGCILLLDGPDDLGMGAGGHALHGRRSVRITPNRWMP